LAVNHLETIRLRTMSRSWILAAVILGAFLLFAGGAWLVARRTPRRRERRPIHLKMAFLIVCGVAFAGYALWVDSGQRRTTLHEVILDGAPAEDFVDGEAVRRIEFVVEHPHVEHDLMIGPMHHTPTTRRANFEVRLKATVAQADAALLFSKELIFTPRYHEATWHAAYCAFTPTAAGPHTLTLRLLTPDIPAVHVRIGDPLKTDGQRPPGY